MEINFLNFFPNSIYLNINSMDFTLYYVYYYYRGYNKITEQVNLFNYLGNMSKYDIL